MLNLGHEIQIAIPGFKTAGSFGFAVDFFNAMSSVKFNRETQMTELETITLLDPSPTSSGAWVSVDVPKWDINFVGRND